MLIFYPKNQIFCHQWGLNMYFEYSQFQGVQENSRLLVPSKRKINSTGHLPRYNIHSAYHFSSDSIYQNTSYPIFSIPSIEKSKPIRVENFSLPDIVSWYIHGSRFPEHVQVVLCWTVDLNCFQKQNFLRSSFQRNIEIPKNISVEIPKNMIISITIKNDDTRFPW